MGQQTQRRMKQTKMYACTLEEFISSRCSHIAVQVVSEIWIGILTGLYTNVTIVEYWIVSNETNTDVRMYILFIR